MESGRELREASKSTTYPADLFRDKWRKQDRGLQSPQPFYTCPRQPTASNIGGSPRYSCNKADTPHDTHGDAGQLYRSPVGTWRHKCALGKRNVMAGTDRDMQLRERPTAPEADLRTPINPNEFLILNVSYVEQSRVFCRRSTLQPCAQPACLSLPPFYGLVNRGGGSLGKGMKPSHPLAEASKHSPSPCTGKGCKTLGWEFRSIPNHCPSPCSVGKGLLLALQFT